MAPLFQHMRFYLSQTLAASDRVELRQLIEQEGGTVSSSTASAVQLVDLDALDARHPEWISTDFVKDSVASQALQQLPSYSGTIFAMNNSDQKERGETSVEPARHGRLKYTVEDDARMLHFVKTRDWKAMQPVPESAWRLAENEHVTAHSASSMHEHFRKQLQRKTPAEQRLILAKAAALVRSRMLEKKPAGALEKEKASPRTRAISRGTSLQDVPTLEHTTLTQASRQPLSSESSHSGAVTPEMPVRETQPPTIKEEKCSARDKRTRIRKPQSPLGIAQRIQRDSVPTTCRGITFPAPTDAIPGQSGLVTPAVDTLVAHATQRGPEKREQGTDEKQQKRKRGTTSIGVAVSQHPSPSDCDTDTSNANDVESETREHDGVFFRSAWAELANDHTKRRTLQRLFEPSSTLSSPGSQASSTVPAVTRWNAVDESASDVAREESSGFCSVPQRTIKTVEHATDEEADHIICQLQFDTHQDMPAVIHAIYYCSGDVDMARSFLKGTMPSGMWSAEDDLLVTNLVAEDVVNRIAVDAAVTRGDFASMRAHRDTDAIVKRVEFLR
ncbi:unnamed protein product [Hyaloperonospora brassicae]|uniref:Telomeric repeat-binding factor 2-interacting protein 1 n=1 Tax=Hyaloperonospora brassicae TaxID=162125 RepID=A0AAV0TBJ5_HYABA|nr:unnamed protein product [Hyaloperonospora brassicae]